jgi:hypothetical protein
MVDPIVEPLGVCICKQQKHRALAVTYIHFLETLLNPLTNLPAIRRIAKHDFTGPVPLESILLLGEISFTLVV